MSGDIVQLCQTVTPECYIGSVAWIKEGNYIALGDSDGMVQVGVYNNYFLTFKSWIKFATVREKSRENNTRPLGKTIIF